jgi:hypothetical protein
MTLLSLKEKYVISSTVAAQTTSTTLVDDPEAIKTFSLSAPQTVLVIYQANTVFGALVREYGMQHAINVDGEDHAKSWDSLYEENYPCRNIVFWLGTLGAGSHTIKGRFATNIAGTATVSNRVLAIVIFDGDEFFYIDDPTTQTTTSGTLVDDPNAIQTFTPSANCKILALYNATNSGATEGDAGKRVAINIGGIDYGLAQKSPYLADFPDSVFTCHGISQGATELTIKGRFASETTDTVSIHRRQLAILLCVDSTLLDTVVSTTEVSTTSNSLVDDPQAVINRTLSDARDVLVVAMGTKRNGVSSNVYGERYGIKIDDNDRANSRGCGYYYNTPNSVGTAYMELLESGSHTIKGRFSNNYGTETAKISARQMVALWFVHPEVPLIEKSGTDSVTGYEAAFKTVLVIPTPYNQIKKEFFNGNGLFWHFWNNPYRTFKDESIFIYTKKVTEAIARYVFGSDVESPPYQPFSDINVIYNPYSSDLTNVYDHNDSTYASIFIVVPGAFATVELVRWDLGSVDLRGIRALVETTNPIVQVYIEVSEDGSHWENVVIVGAETPFGNKYEGGKILNFRYIRWMVHNTGGLPHDVTARCFTIDIYTPSELPDPWEKFVYKNLGDDPVNFSFLLLINGNILGNIYTKREL